MNQYIKFIVRVLLTCFLLPFRRYNTSFMWPRTVSMGMVLGYFYNGTLLAKFSFAWSIHCIRDPYKAVRKARRQMIWRLMLVGSLVVLGIKDSRHRGY